VNQDPARPIVIQANRLSKMFILQHNRGLKRKLLTLFDPRLDEVRNKWRTPFHAVHDVSFTLRKGEALALLGHNGSGKSTLLQLVCGILQPSSGVVETHGRIAPLIALGVGFHPELTGVENIYLNASLLGLSNKQIRSRFNDIVDFSELGNFIDTPVKHYSSGMYMRLGLSVALHVEPQIMLADEILTVGDAHFQEKCATRIRDMQADGMALILVTHTMEQARHFCQRFITLDHGRVIDQGDFTDGTPENIFLQLPRK